MEEIDLLVNIAGENNEVVHHYALKFLRSLVGECDLQGVNVFIVTRECLPLADETMAAIEAYNRFETVVCPLPRTDNCMEDTGRVCNWMVDNCGEAPWVTISHYDVEFHKDYITHLRLLISTADMVGRHHDGIVSMRREAYRLCCVGFCGMREIGLLVNSSGEINIVPTNTPRSSDLIRPALSLDVGEVLELRMANLKLRHLWHRKESDPDDIGKSDLFTHYRDGSRSEIVKPDVVTTTWADVMEQLNLHGQLSTLIHLIYEPTTLSGWRIACMPNMTEFHSTPYHPNYQRTDFPAAVTCPACKRTDAYKQKTGGGL